MANPPRVLVTRPAEDAEPLIAALRRRGAEVLAQPMLRIDFRAGPAPALDGVQALLFTSANGVRAFARRCDDRGLPAYAVGDASAAAARAAGFERVESADGDVTALAALVVAHGDPGAGALLHAAGSAVAGDLAGRLEGAGFTVRREVLYSAEAATALDPAVRDALAGGGLDAALFFSPRGAATFVSLSRAAGLSESCAGVRLLGLSAAVAEAAGALTWRSVTVAADPTQDALLAAFDEIPFDETMTQDTDAETPTASDQGPPDRALDAPADAVIEVFGGIRPMATKLGVPVTTVQGWKSRGRIPGNRHAAVHAAATRHGVDLSVLADTPGAEAPRAADKPAPPANQRPQPGRPASAPGGKPGGGRVAWAALVLSLLALAAVVTLPIWVRLLPYPAAGPLAGGEARLGSLEDAVGRLDPLAAQLAALQRRLGAISESTGKSGDAGPALAELRFRLTQTGGALDALTAKLGAHESQAKSTARLSAEAIEALRRTASELQAAAAALDKRVAELEARPLVSGERLAALAVSLGQLEGRLADGRPYAAALDRLRALAGEDRLLVKTAALLAPHAARGIPSERALAQRFDKIAPTLTAKPEGGAEPGLIESLRDKALSLINMRKVGGDDVTSPVTRAERALARGDLAAAASALDGLDGAARGWVADAKARVAAESAAGALRGLLVELLAKSAGKSPGGGKTSAP